MSDCKISGGVYCDICKKTICRPRKRKNFRQEFYMTCNECENGKFSDQKFILVHLGNNRWIIKNIRDESWCGIGDEWVHVNSSYFQMDPDCQEKVFDFEELVEFVKNRFQTNLK